MARHSRLRDERGFTLAEMMIAMAVMLIICGAIVGALIQMTNTQRTIFNRTEMHSGVRGATELLQQEVGQAGRIALPAAVTLSAAIAGAGTFSPTVNSSTGMFVGEQLTVGQGANEETVTVTAVSSSPASFTAVFTSATGHNSGEAVMALGGFEYGIVPPSVTNGSTGSILKMFGDINGDGNMEYVEYTCDTAGGNLYRNSIAWTPTVTTKPAVGVAQVLLGNITSNPGGAACFTYQTEPPVPFVVDVAITLTVQTQQTDAYTGGKQTETKALLNVTPRNIFNVWQLYGQQIFTRVQNLPPNVTTNLLP